MKDLWLKTKWLALQAKPFTHYLLSIVIFGSISSLIGIYRALITKRLIDIATSSQLSNLFRVLGILAVTIILDIGSRVAVTLITSKCSIKISNNIQRKLYNGLMKTKWMEFSKYHSGDVLTRMTSDVDAITGMLVTTIPNIISLSILLIGSFITLLVLDPFLAVVFIILSPSTILLSRFYSSKLKKIYLKYQALESKYRSFLNESFQNMLIVKAFCLGDRNINIVEDIQEDRVQLTVTRTKMSAVTNVALSLGYWISYFLVFCFNASKLSKGTTTFGTLTALIQLVGNIQGPFYGLASSLPQVVAAIASTERIMELENLDFESNDLIIENMKSSGALFQNVDFSYKEDKMVLNNVSVNINSGETVALVGPSGEGKTTFIHLLLSLITPKKGHLYITNNLENIEVSAGTRKFMSYVPQGNTLFSGTIAENLRLGRPNATDEELEAAAKGACAWDFIKNLPEGLDTKLGERGVGLSEGQAQRIAIARALLHKAPILILDEATSALDSETEIRVLKSIQNLDPTPTCIIITHRNTALRICDRVFRIEDRHIVEQNSLIHKDIAADVV
ncbi:ABC transporter ATP-binding protein [Clostridium sp. WILCCON 0269]|uniref:ABC transporter ATP-binding protein n=1 Tax=Candidatus Clostridium eludens TaxID=3381663 RepID=A0ABW8SS45_9CLOT